VPGGPSQVNEAPLTSLAPFEREQRLRKYGRWCAGICGNSLLQAAEAGLQLVGTELTEEGKSAQGAVPWSPLRVDPMFRVTVRRRG
jgi:hypothetical protein